MQKLTKFIQQGSRFALLIALLVLVPFSPQTVSAALLTATEEADAVDALPNLQVNQWSFGGGFALADTAMGDQLTLELANESEQAVPAGYLIQLYISTDPIISTDDMPLTDGKLDGPAIPPASTTNIVIPASARIPGGFPIGVAYLGVLVDSDEQVEEAAEDDNQAGLAVVVLDPNAPFTWLVTTAQDILAVGTLRHALTYARSGDTIKFDGAQFFTNAQAGIVLMQPLPAITQGDLRIVSAASGVFIDGLLLPAGSDGLVIASDDNHLSGVSVRNMPGDAIQILGNNNRFDGDLDSGQQVAAAATVAGPAASPIQTVSNNSGNGIVIAGDGNVVDGTYLIANGANGIVVLDGATDTTIGSTLGGRGNLIGGNQQAGVRLQGSGAQNNQVVGNFVGASFDGFNAFANQGNGVVIAQGATNNQVGGSGVGEGNLISGNFGAGILIEASDANNVRGNLIGTRADGVTHLPNSNGGIRLANAAGNQIGGVSPATCSTDCNLISGNNGSGLTITGAGSSGNVVYGNSVGLNKNWSGTVSNGGNGIEIRNGAHDNQIGGLNDGEANSIAGNLGHGLLLQDAGVQNNLVQANRIGGNFDGNLLGNGGYGVVVGAAAAFNQVGGLTTQANTIRYNVVGGVLIDNSTHTTVWHNMILLNGDNPAGDPGSGVLIRNGSSNSQVKDNNISLNFGHGVAVVNASQNLIRLNTVANNNAEGVYLQEAIATEVISNSVSGNDNNGIYLFAARNNQVRGNRVQNNGTLPNDSATGQGIVLTEKSNDNIIASNFIKNNLGDGLRVFDLSVDNTLGQNEVQSNQDHGIHVSMANTNVLTQNHIVDSAMNGIYLFNVDTCLVISNVVDQNSENGIELEQTRNCLITTNVVRDSGDDDVNAAAVADSGTNLQNGILLHDASHHNDVIDNEISNNKGSGIRVTNFNTELNTFNDNELDRNRLYGLLFIDGARDNSAAHNKIWQNKEAGIGVLGPDTLRNRLSENSIYANVGLAIDNVGGGNTELTPPVVTAYLEYTPTLWVITGTTCANCVVEVFSDFGAEGIYFEGATTSDGGGAFVIDGLNRTGHYFALTTRLADNNTSELNVINDMTVSDIEVTQVVQSVDTQPNFDNVVRLIADKPTVVRVYASSSVGVMPNVTAVLYGQHNGVDLGGLTPNHEQCAAVIEVVPEPDRAILGQSFCFVLPDHWIANGDLGLIAQVNPTSQAPETNYTNNTHALPAALTFESPGASPRLRFYRFAHRESLVRGISVQRKLHEKDDIDVGDIDGDGRNDIVVASRDSNRLIVYPTGDLTATDSAQITIPLTSIVTTFDDGYAMAVGDVDDESRVEIVVASDKVGDDPDIRVFEWNGSELVYQDGFDGDFTILDALAIGQLIPDGTGYKEIAVAGDVTGRVDIFRWNGSTWTKVDDFDSTYDATNSFAVGDVIDGDGVDEVLIGRNGRDEIDVYQWNGAGWSKIATFDAKIKGASGLVAADVDGELFEGNMLEEIIVGNPKSNCRCLDVYHLTESGWQLASRSDGFNFDEELKPFHSGDLLAAGNLDLDDKAEVVVGQLDKSQLKVYTKRMIGEWDVVVTDDIHVRYLRSYLLRVLPIIDLTVLGALDGTDLLLANDAGTPDADELNSLMRKMQRQADEHKSDNLVIYYGMVSDQDEFMRGRSRGEGEPASGPTGVNHRWDKDGSFGDWYGTHEIGHSLDRPHARFCGAEDEEVNYPDYAYEQDSDVGDEAFIGGPPENRLRFYGFDTGDASLTLTDGTVGLPMRVFPGDKWTDLMSYCDFEWLSDYNYNNFYNHLNSLFPAAIQQVAPGEHLALEGALNLTAEEGVVYNVYTLANPGESTASDPDSSLVLRLENLNGATIASYGLKLTPDSDPEPGGSELASFEAVVPLPADLVMLRILYGVTEIFSRTVSLNRPVVSLRTPNGGETLDGPVVVEWQGRDVDGDELRYSLFYSADGGASYQPITVNWPEERYELNTTQLRGTTQGRFKVVVDDGVYSSEDVSDGLFSVAANPLRAEILSPANNSVSLVGQDLLLRGRAAVPNGEVIDDLRYEWRSDQQGLLGSEKSLLLSDLPVGVHMFTLKVSGGSNPPGEARVRIQVSNAYDNLSSPVAADDSSSTAEETAVEIAVLENDGDPNGDPLTIVAVEEGLHGATEIVNEGRGVRYTPDPDFIGTEIFAYTIADGTDGTDSALVSVVVTGVNDPPVANDDWQMTPVDTAVSVFILANDFDAEHDALAVLAVQDPAHGTVQLRDADILYQPNAGFIGVDTFEYTVQDGNGGQGQAQVTVHVGTITTLSAPPVNEQPAPTGFTMFLPFVGRN